MPGSLVCLALKEEHDSSVDLEVVKVACWDPVMGSRSWTGVGLEELHSLVELELEELYSLIELELGELHNLFEVGQVWQSLRLDSWVDSLQVELEVQQQLEVEVGNWAPPRLEELCS